jgi:hypothetical protein
MCRGLATVERRWGRGPLHRRADRGAARRPAFGLGGATAALEGLDKPSPTEAIGVLRARSSEFSHGILTDDICLLAARIT